jgi:phage-related minor tail protein
MAVIDKKNFIEADAIKKELKEIISLFEQSEAAIKDITKASLDLQNATRSINKDGSGAEAKKRVQLTTELEKNTKQLTEVQKEQIRLDSQRQKLTAKLITAGNKRNQQLAKGKIQLQEINKQTKENIKLEKAQAGSLEQLRLQTVKLTKERDKLGDINGKNAKQFRTLTTQINKNNQALIAADKQIVRNQRSVGNYGDALKGVGRQLLGAAGIVGGVDLAIQGFQKFAQTTREINDITRKVITNFGGTNKEAKALASNINALATTFEQDYNEVLIAANTVSKELGISGQEATKLIEEGFLKGSNNSGEFLDILKEYPAQFASVGIDADTAFAIINQQVREGIYSDKGVDAIKEAGLRLRENTKAVQEALAPLDESIRLQIEQEIAAGNSFKAIQLVSEALKDTSLSAEETQRLIADVFGGPGEDAGLRYLQTLADIETNLGNVAIQASESEQANLNLSKSWNQFVAGVSKSNGIFAKTFNFLKNFLASAINSLTFLIDLIDGQEKAAKKLTNSFAKLNAERQKNIDATEMERLATVRLINANGDLVDGNGKLIKSKQDLEKASKARQRALIEENKQLIKQIKIQQNLLILPFKQIAEEDKEQERLLKQEQAAAESLALTEETENERADIVLSVGDSAAEQRLEKEKILQEGLKELALNSIDTVSSALTEGRQQDAQFAIDSINSQAEAEKEILKQQLADNLITEKEFKDRTAAIDKQARRDSAKEEKRASLFNIGINTAVAVVKALASSPPPLNFVNAAIVGALGAVQAAIVAAKPLPAFAEGVIGFKGKGTAKSDSNLAKISNGESVITAKGTTNAPITLDAINRGLITDRDMTKGMTRSQSSSLLASLLKQGNEKSDQMILALANLSSTKDYGSYLIETKGSGQVFKHNK